MGKKDEAKQDLTKEVEMTEHTDSIEKVCESYGVKPSEGLSDAEAKKRLERDGYNELTPPKVKCHVIFPFQPLCAKNDLKIALCFT